LAHSDVVGTVGVPVADQRLVAGLTVPEEPDVVSAAEGLGARAQRGQVEQTISADSQRVLAVPAPVTDQRGAARLLELDVDVWASRRVSAKCRNVCFMGL
jgi:hypothetical protein